MASYVNNPELWRLHSNNGVVPFKYLGVEGSFEPESGSVTMKALIRANTLIAFLIETFPPPVQIGNLLVPQSAGLPGLPGMCATKVSFRAQDDGLPTDPFGFDTTAPDGTYNKLLEVTIDYGLNKIQKPDPTDPLTFLEISCQSKSEYIAMAAAGGPSRVQEETPAPTNPPPDKVPAGKGTNKPFDSNVRLNKKVIRNPNASYKVVVPLTEWTVKWNQISFQYWRDVLIYRLRWAEGHLNASNLPWLYYAEPETVLFEGFSMNQQYSWRDGSISTPPCTVEMKFTEKRVIWRGQVCGHNHIWVPGTGWKYYLVDGVNPMYETRNMNGLFQA